MTHWNTSDFVAAVFIVTVTAALAAWTPAAIAKFADNMQTARAQAAQAFDGDVMEAGR